MAFEREGGDTWSGRSPGGFEFGVQGFVYGPPIPKSVTFFLDNTAVVADQYGNRVKGVQMPDGTVVIFADKAPDGNKEGDVVPRPQFATHAQVIEALLAERIDWLSYELRWRSRDGRTNTRTGLTLADAVKQQTKLLQDGNPNVAVERSIACAGWPQLPYEQLKKLPDVPQTPIEELRKIRDPEMRKAALRLKREFGAARDKEMQAAVAEDE